MRKRFLGKTRTKAAEEICFGGRNCSGVVVVLTRQLGQSPCKVLVHKSLGFQFPPVGWFPCGRLLGKAHRQLVHRSQVGNLRSRHTPCAVPCVFARIHQSRGRHTECACYSRGGNHLRSLVSRLSGFRMSKSECGRAAVARGARLAIQCIRISSRMARRFQWKLLCH